MLINDFMSLREFIYTAHKKFKRDKKLMRDDSPSKEMAMPLMKASRDNDNSKRIILQNMKEYNNFKI